MDVAFSYVTKGLQTSFHILTRVPAKATLSWDFGDFKGSSELRNPVYDYEEEGIYTVTLTITPEDGDPLTTEQTVMVSSDENINNHLSASIYELIDNYIPQELDKMTFEQKSTYIIKWQLYIGPLVNHPITPDKYQDELAYEGLENQLIMELAAYDYLNVQMTALLNQTKAFLENVTKGDSGSSNENNTEKPEGKKSEGKKRIKRITTGPTEVEYFDEASDSIASWWKYYMQALQPGGIIDILKQNLCTLAYRLDIYLPFCDKVRDVTVPKVVNRRKAGPLGGPNPTSVLNGTHDHVPSIG